MQPVASLKPVLIVGAGPTGLTAALELSRLGIPVRLIDKASGPSGTSRALAVQSRTLELLGQRGLAAAMVAAGNPAYSTTIYANNQELGRVDLRLIPSRYNFCLLLAQSETERFLREALAQPVAPEWGTALTGFVQQPAGGISARLTRADGQAETYEAAYLISAEGAHSEARRILNLSFEGKTLGQHYALGDLHLDGNIPEDELSIFTSDDGFVALFPMRNRRFRLMVTDPAHHTKADAPPTLAELQGIFDHLVPHRAQLRDMVWSSRYGINSRMMSTLRVGDVFFGGDAAHIHSPAGGQGMNTGIQDMLNLAWKLALVLRGQARPALLDTYEPERLQIIASLLATTEKGTDLFNSTNPLVHWLLRALLPPALHLPFVQRQGTAIISETANHYTNTPLNGPGSPIGTLGAGLRLPDTDLRVQVAAGPAGRLYELLHPARFTVLALNGLPLTGLSARPDLLDALALAPLTAADHAEFAQLFGTQPAFVLVRPDAYVACCGRASELAAMEHWLAEWLVPQG